MHTHRLGMVFVTLSPVAGFDPLPGYSPEVWLRSGYSPEASWRAKIWTGNGEREGRLENIAPRQ